MTDTGTPVDDIIVNGQTARGPSPFADLQWPSKGNTGGSGQITDQPQDPSGEGPGIPNPSDEQIACADPVKAKQWNKDAKAATDALAALRAAAFNRYQEDLQMREYGALLCQFSTGQLEVGPVFEGGPLLDENGTAIEYPDGRPSVPIGTTSCPAGSVPVGYIHSHPGTGALPSDADFGFLQTIALANGVDVNSLSAYTVATYYNPNTNQYLDRMTRGQYSERATAQTGAYSPA